MDECIDSQTSGIHIGPWEERKLTIWSSKKGTQEIWIRICVDCGCVENVDKKETHDENSF